MIGATIDWFVSPRPIPAKAKLTTMPLLLMYARISSIACAATAK